MVMAVFRSRLLDEGSAAFQVLADEMLEIARSMPGFLSYQVYKSEDAARCSIIEFESREDLLAWRNHPRHQAAQKAGRQRFYSAYSLYVAEPERESHFER